MLLLGTDTGAAGNAVVASDPVQKLAYLVAALTTLVGLIGIFRALCTFFGARPTAMSESNTCEACSDSAQRATKASQVPVCTLCGSSSSNSA